MTGLDRRLQPGAMIEGEQHVVERGAIGHGVSSKVEFADLAAVIP